jgi:hypothetical protein
MSMIARIVVGAFGLVVFAGSAGAAEPTVLSRAEMKNIRGEAFIKYGALKHDAPNAKAGRVLPLANPASRGCSAINRCRS